VFEGCRGKRSPSIDVMAKGFFQWRGVTKGRGVGGDKKKGKVAGLSIYDGRAKKMFEI